MLTKNSRIRAMLANGWIPRVGEFVDSYNKVAVYGVCGTILTRISAGNHYYVVVKTNRNPNM